MPSRKDLKKQKEKTSQALIDAALELSEVEGFASLSLRSVARKAGIAPTSFYRHFREIDEMGVEIVAQAQAALEDCLVRAGKKMTFPASKKNTPPPMVVKSIDAMVRPFVMTFITCFRKNKALLYLFFQEQTGSSESMRLAISEATDQLIGLLTQYLQPLDKMSDSETVDIDLIAESLMTILSAAALAMMTQPKAKTEGLAERAIRKFTLILIGALLQGQITRGDGHE